MLEPNYVLGLVDGEGSFYVRINDHKRRAKIELKFSLKLRHQDRHILEELQRFFGCGKIYIQRDGRINHSLCYRFEVNNKKELFEKVNPFFEKNPPLLPSRKRDFDLFKEICELLKSGSQDFEKIQSLKALMHWGSPYTGKPSVRWEREVTPSSENAMPVKPPE
ncbi:LAGLIDADG family homing endonuclease [Candidatus Woesearchaeota archaeon]|nr:LAGLIDADG family homing endonuclease [Candidatus Woesearchaeota archaeon]